MKQFVQITVNGKRQVINLSCIYSFNADENGGCTIITNSGHRIYIKESFDEICEALDELLR